MVENETGENPNVSNPGVANLAGDNPTNSLGDSTTSSSTTGRRGRSGAIKVASRPAGPPKSSTPAEPASPPEQKESAAATKTAAAGAEKKPKTTRTRRSAQNRAGRGRNQAEPDTADLVSDMLTQAENSQKASRSASQPADESADKPTVNKAADPVEAAIEAAEAQRPRRKNTRRAAKKTSEQQAQALLGSITEAIKQDSASKEAESTDVSPTAEQAAAETSSSRADHQLGKAKEKPALPARKSKPAIGTGRKTRLELTSAESSDSADNHANAESEDLAAADDTAAVASQNPRRRRRGGRRRNSINGSLTRDNQESAQTSTEDGDVDQDSATDDLPVADGETKPGEQTEQGAESAIETSSVRRRRRRRRRGEDVGPAEDDPSNVVVKVREPRRSSQVDAALADSGAAINEITGIEGSTRMEAKRQRRREGRAAGRRRTPILSEAEFLSRRESVKRQLVIKQSEDHTQLAVIEDNSLVEHYVDRPAATGVIGNIYLGRVQNVLPSMEACFIDIGRGRNAVLYAGEVDWDSYGEVGKSRKMEDVFKSGQTVIVQVSKDPVGAKGARLTAHITIPGRFVVYSPNGHLSGISRKLPDSERSRLRDILAEALPESASVIVRTAAEGASEQELKRDVERLENQWKEISKKAKQSNAPEQLYSEPDLTLRIVRDLFTEDFDGIWIQGIAGENDVYERIYSYVEKVAPSLTDRVHRWEDADLDLFTKYRVDEQIAKGLERKVFLPSGGSLVIDRTEAMTVIDVNTGKFTGSAGNLEATVAANNLEAAEEIVRQLRLRDIGGIVVIDFIDMVLPSNRELLLRRLVECLGRDRTRHQVAEITSLGLVQMTRKRIGTGLAEAFTEQCDHCHGRGYVRFDTPVDSQAPADGGDRPQNSKPNRRFKKNNHQHSDGSVEQPQSNSQAAQIAAQINSASQSSAAKTEPAPDLETDAAQTDVSSESKQSAQPATDENPNQAEQTGLPETNSGRKPARQRSSRASRSRGSSTRSRAKSSAASEENDSPIDSGKEPSQDSLGVEQPEAAVTENKPEPKTRRRTTQRSASRRKSSSQKTAEASTGQEQLNND